MICRLWPLPWTPDHSEPDRTFFLSFFCLYYQAQSAPTIQLSVICILWIYCSKTNKLIWATGPVHSLQSQFSLDTFMEKVLFTVCQFVACEPNNSFTSGLLSPSKLCVVLVVLNRVESGKVLGNLVGSSMNGEHKRDEGVTCPSSSPFIS